MAKANERKPSILSDRGLIGSSSELDEYGVWVKSEPQDLSLAHADSEGIHIGGGYDDPVLESANDDFDLSDIDFDLPSMDDLEASLKANESEDGYTEVSLDELLGTNASGNQAMDDFGNDRSAASDLSNQLLRRIAEELSSIRVELGSLKNELSSVRNEDYSQFDTEESGFFDEETDEKISLTGDEMDNILNTADFNDEIGTGEEIDLNADDLAIDDLAVEELGAEEFAPIDLTAEEQASEDLSLDGFPEIEEEPVSQDDFSLLDNINIELEESELEETLSEEEPNLEDLSISLDLEELNSSEPESEDLESDDTLSNDINIEGYNLDELIDEELNIELPQFEDSDEVPSLVVPSFEVPSLEEPSFEEPVIEESTETLELELESLEPEAELEPETTELEGFESLELDSLDLDVEDSPSSDVLDLLEDEAETPAIDLPSFEFDEDPLDTGGDLSLIPEGFVAEEEIEVSPVEETEEEILEDLEILEPAGEETMETVEVVELPEVTPLVGEEPRQQYDTIPAPLKQELRTVLGYMDQLLESLPDDKIEEFARSEHFETYRKLFKELGLE
ncbi:MAG: hypothetical protein FWH12_09010 [Treponema sp.]|nr:hypothetical protein [Treponema sp.]